MEQLGTVVVRCALESFSLDSLLLEVCNVKTRTSNCSLEMLLEELEVVRYEGHIFATD